MPNTAFRPALMEYLRAQARPLDKFSHQPRLYALARQLGEGKSYDDDVLFAAAWLHDLGIFVGHRPEDPAALAAWDHVAYIRGRAPELLRGFGFPEEKICAVLTAIAEHLPTADPGTPEGMLLRDADILEQLGAVGILRTVSKVGRDTRFFTFRDALAQLHRNASELPGKLRLAEARREAEPRLRVLEEFLAAAEAEADGEPL
ncbi:MAG: HD domain-containing protein [Chthoniobacteraceae bacterium]|nr:HD domain-containing protein [Chthoniobacteraceae bacterium]